MIIGLSGYARSGKDEAAKGLVELGFQRVAFADRLREFLYTLNPAVFPAKYVSFSPLEETHAQTVQWVIDKYGWDDYKNSPWGPGVREFLQRLGTECGRELIGQNVWVDAALKQCYSDHEGYVITDARFENEAQGIRARGGIIVRITRPGVTAANAHVSETALDAWPFDAYIDNDGSIEDLHRKIHEVAKPYIPRAY